MSTLPGSEVAKTSTLFGPPTGESPTDSNPFAFAATLSKPQHEQVEQVTVTGSTEFVSGGIGDAYTGSGGNPYGALTHPPLTNDSAVVHRPLEDASEPPRVDFVGRKNSGPQNMATLFGGGVGGGNSSGGFFDSIPVGQPLQGQISNPLQQQMQWGNQSHGATNSGDMTGSAGQTSLAEPSFPEKDTVPTDLLANTGSDGDAFFSHHHQQPLSLPLTSTQESSFPRTSGSAPSTAVHQILTPSPQQFPPESFVSSTPHSLPTAPVVSTNNEGAPRYSSMPVQIPQPPATTTYNQQQPNMEFIEESPVYPRLTNADLPNPGYIHPSMIHDPMVTTNARSSSSSLVHPRVPERPYPAATTITTFTTETGMSSQTGSDINHPAFVTSEVPATGGEEDLESSMLNDSLNNNPSVSSLLENSQEDFTRSSPIRLIPPVPLGQERDPASSTLQGALPQDTYGGPSLLPPAPLESVLHTPATTPSTNTVMYTSTTSDQLEMKRGSLPLSSVEVITRQADSEYPDWEIVDDVAQTAPPIVEGGDRETPLLSQPPTSVEQQVTEQLSTLSLEQVHYHAQQQVQNDGASTATFNPASSAQSSAVPQSSSDSLQSTPSVTQYSTVSSEQLLMNPGLQGHPHHQAPPTAQPLPQQYIATTTVSTIQDSIFSQRNTEPQQNTLYSVPPPNPESMHTVTSNPGSAATDTTTTTPTNPPPMRNLISAGNPLSVNPGTLPQMGLQSPPHPLPPATTTQDVPPPSVARSSGGLEQSPLITSVPSQAPVITATSSTAQHSGVLTQAQVNSNPHGVNPDIPLGPAQVLNPHGAAPLVDPHSSTKANNPHGTNEASSVAHPVTYSTTTNPVTVGATPTESRPPLGTSQAQESHDPVAATTSKPAPVTTVASATTQLSTQTSQTQDSTLKTLTDAHHQEPHSDYGHGDSRYDDGRSDYYDDRTAHQRQPSSQEQDTYSEYGHGSSRYDDSRYGDGHYHQPGYYGDRYDPYPPHSRYERQRYPSTYSERAPDPYTRDYHRPRPHSRATHEYPPYHDPRDPHHPDYRRYGPEYDDPYHQSQYGYRDYHPLPARDYRYGPPHGRYYDDYHHGYDERYRGPYHGPPTNDPRYGGTDPHYDYDHRYHHPHQPSSYDHDSGPQGGHHYQDPHSQPQYDTQGEDLNPAETSSIYGNQNNFEISQTFMDSPNTRQSLPQHPHHTQHESTTYMESYGDGYVHTADYHQQQGDYPHYQEQGHHGEVSYEGEYGHYDYTDGQQYHHHHHQGDVYGSTEHYYNQEGYPQQEGYNEQDYPQEGYGEEEQPQGQQQWAPIEVTPPPPPRETPEQFAHPHVRVSFGFGGQLVTVLPNNPLSKQPAVVEISSIQGLVGDKESAEFKEAVNSSPSPFIVGETPKSHVIKFASQEAAKCREKKAAYSGQQQVENELEDEALLWDFLVLLCQQNGVVLPSDIADLLMRDGSSAVKSTTHFGASAQEESLDSLRQLLLAGRKKDALDLACAKSLWGHALMLASRMDEQSRTYVVNRFTASLMTTDPLSTFYTLILGRTPSAVKPEGLMRAGDWKPHLAMILANRTSKLDNDCIVSLGDSLLAQGRLHAAHLCYYLANVHFGAYGDLETKYSLLGVDHARLKVGIYPKTCELQKMEVFEYAMSLNKQEFSLPHFQMFKYLFVLKLVEMGFVKKALKYCEQISCYVVKGPHSYLPTFLQSLVDLSVKLHHQNSPFGVVETELPSWLLHLQQSVTDVLASDYNPSLFSPSPAFSSVSQTYTNQPPSSQQPIIGIQAGPYLSVPSGIRSSATSSKEGSVINAQQSNEANAAAAKTNTISGLVVATHQLEVYGSSQTTQQQQEPQVQQSQETTGQALAASVPQYGQYDGTTLTEVPSQTQAQVTPGVGLTTETQDGGGDGGGNVLMSVPPEGSAVSLVGDHQQQPQQQEYQHQFQGYQTQGQYYPYQGQDGVPGFMQQQPLYSNDYGLSSSQPSTVALQQDGQNIQQPLQPQSDIQPQPPHESSQQTVSNFMYGGGGGTTDTTAGQVNPYDYRQTFSPLESSEDMHKQKQQELESSTKTEAESKPSHESHVTGKEQKKEEEKNEKDKKKGDEKKGQQGTGGGGWGFGLLKYLVPKKKNQAHLPDDKNPRIIWDEEKKAWIDLDADEQEQAGPAAPPTDAELNKGAPKLHSHQVSAPPSHPSSHGGGGVDSTDGGGPPSQGGPPKPTSNMYSRQSNRRGRLGARSKYVDVMNPGGTTSSGSQDNQPAAPPPMMLGGTTQPFTGTFFVPPPVQGDDANVGSNNSETVQSSGDQVAQASSGGTQPPSHGGGTTEASHAVPQSNQLTQQDVYTPQSQQQDQQQPLYQNQQPPHQLSNHQLQQQNQQQLSYPQHQDSGNYQAPPSQEPTSTTHDHMSTSQQQQPSQQPQFFNPSAFAPVVNAFPQAAAGHRRTTEPQDDSMSTVSLMSESSQEVSRYMHKPHTSSAGYSRLKQGIRGVRGYPTMPVGGAPQQRPPTSSGAAPPPGAAGLRSNFQPRQPWQ